MQEVQAILARVSTWADLALMVFAVSFGRRTDRYTGAALLASLIIFYIARTCDVPIALCDPITTIGLILALAPVPLFVRRTWVAMIILLQGFQLLIDAGFYAGAVAAVESTWIMNTLTFVCAAIAAAQSWFHRQVADQPAAADMSTIPSPT